MAICWFPHVIRRRDGGYDSYCVRCHISRRETEERDWVEGSMWIASARGHFAVRWNGYNSKFSSKRRGEYATATDSRLQAFLYNNDDRFYPGWKLDSSWALCTISWIVALLLAGGISSAAVLLPSEGGYELILDEE